MKCLRKYKWVKLLRAYLPAGKGLLGYWAKLASRAAFRKGNAVYCGHINPVAPGMWSGGVVGLKSILGVKKRAHALWIINQLQDLGYLTYTLDSKTKHLTYQISDWVVKCSGEECMDGAVYATDEYGFLCMVGSQLLLLVMNVWFLRGFASSMGQFIANGGALSSGKGSIFLWMFCALAYLKCAQRFDSYLASIGLNVAQTGSSMGMELLMAARVLTGAGSGARSAGSVFSRGGSAATGTGAAASGFAAGFASKFSPNSYVRDAVVDGGTRMGFGGGAGFVARAFGGIAARNGATLNGDSISSVASRSPNASGMIAGNIADRSLSNYMPHMKGFQMQGTQITGGHISTTATTPNGKKANVDMYNASQYEKPDAPHSVVTASDGSQWYQMASGEGRGAFYDAPVFGGMEAQQGQAGNVHTDASAGAVQSDSENVGAQVHDTDSAAPGNLVSGADGVPQGVGAFPGDQTAVEGDSGSLTENPGIVPGVSDMPGMAADQPGGVDGVIDPVVPAAIVPASDGVPQGVGAIPGDVAPSEGFENIPESTGFASGVAEMPGMGAVTPADQMPAFTPGIQENMDAVQPGVVHEGGMPVMSDGTDQNASQMPEFGAAFVASPGTVPAAAGFVGDADDEPHSVGVGQVETGVSGGADTPQMGDTFVPVEGGQNIIAFPGGPTEMPAESMGGPGGSEGIVDAPQFGGAFVPGADPGQYHEGSISGGTEGSFLDGSYDGGAAEASNVPYGSDGAGFSGSGEGTAVPDTDANAPQFGTAFVGGEHILSSDGNHAAGGAGEPYQTGDHVSGGDYGHGGEYHGGYAEAPLVAATFPSAQEGTMLRTVGDGVIEASSPDGGNTLWYNSAYYQEPDAPHSVMEAANGVQWYAMQQQGSAPHFEAGEEAQAYNQSAFQQFMPGYGTQVSQVDGSHRQEGHFEVRNTDGSGTRFYDVARYAAPRGDYQVFEDARGSQWYAIRGEAAVERRPVFENGRPVYDGDNAVC